MVTLSWVLLPIRVCTSRPFCDHLLVLWLLTLYLFLEKVTEFRFPKQVCFMQDAALALTFRLSRVV